MSDSLQERFRDALGTLLGWGATVVGALIIAFCLGYWTGHGEITPLKQTARAFGQLFFVWIGFPQLIFAWVVTAFVFYIPLRFQSHWLQLGMLVAHFAIWCCVVHSMVAQTDHAKFFHY